MIEHDSRMSPLAAQRLRQLALFLTFLLSGGNNVFPRVPIAIALIVLLFVINGSRFGIRREMAGIGVLMLGIFAVAIIGSGEFLTENILIRFTNFGLGALMLGTYLGLPRHQFVTDIAPLLFLMVWQTLITAFLGTFAQGLFTTIDINESIYYTIGWIFTFPTALQGGGLIVRPSGFFFEPGVLQMYLNIYLFIVAFVKPNRNRLFLAAFAVATTQSTMGLVIAAALIAAYYFKNMASIPFPTKLLISAFAPLAFIPLLLIVLSNVNEKVSGEFQGSTWARQYDLNTGLGVALANPVIGIGFDYSRYYREARIHGYKATRLDDESITNRGNSNGIVTVLYAIGFPMGIIIFLGLFRQKFFDDRWKFSFVIMASMMSEALFFSPFLLMFVYSGLLLRPPAAATQTRQLRSAAAA